MEERKKDEGRECKDRGRKLNEEMLGREEIRKEKRRKF